MNGQKFKYVVPREDATWVEVSKDTRRALRAFAKSEGLTTVAATYLVIKVGFTCLLAKDQKRKRELVNKVMRLGRIAWEREVGKIR